MENMMRGTLLYNRGVRFGEARPQFDAENNSNPEGSKSMPLAEVGHTLEKSDSISEKGSVSARRM